jgi:hypothetical protein
VWYVVGLGTLCLSYVVDVLLRAFTVGSYCSLGVLIDLVGVIGLSCGVALAYISPKLGVIGSSSAVLCFLYPSKQLLVILVDAKCRAEVQALDINESYSVDECPKDASYFESPGVVKPSEVEVLC